MCSDDECSATFWELTLLPAASFVLHECYYFFVTSFVKRKKLKVREKSSFAHAPCPHLCTHGASMSL